MPAQEVAAESKPNRKAKEEAVTAKESVPEDMQGGH